MNIFTDRRFRLPRKWSNKELKKFSHYFHGDVINVSGWNDVDKEGEFYSQYFNNSSTYTISNYSGQRGFSGKNDEIFLDLSVPLDKNLYGKFDVVFNHTTLEHIFDFSSAFQNICNLSRDVVILVVPFAQIVHENSSYDDFWRFTPSSISKLFIINKYKIIYQSCSPNWNAGIYLFFIASKNSKKWKKVFPLKNRVKRSPGYWIGIHPFRDLISMFIKFIKY